LVPSPDSRDAERRGTFSGAFAYDWHDRHLHCPGGIAIPQCGGPEGLFTRGQLFDGKVDGRSVVKRSTTPFCDAARILLAEGADPVTKIVMRHAGSAADALRSTIGAAAKQTVADDNGGKPIFRQWSPYDRQETLPVASPMRQTPAALARVPDAPELAPEAVP
jgi:hypothetical protein